MRTMMGFNHPALGVTCVLLVAGLAGCSSSVKVERVSREPVIDLSGHWNDTDSRMVAQELISDITRNLWIDNFFEVNHRKPVIIVGPVDNRSHDHIDTSVFTKEIEQALLKTGRVTLVASPTERTPVRDERLQQNEAGWTDPETIKAIGKEKGADFMMIGRVTSVKDEVKGRYVILYQVSLELVDLLTNEKVWIGTTHLRKKVSRKHFSL